MRLILLLVFTGIISFCFAQKIYPPDEIIFINNGANARLCLYQPSTTRLIIFERNTFWFSDMNGNLLEGPYAFGTKSIEPLSPRLSPSGNFVSLNYPSEDIGMDHFLVIYDLNNKRLINADKLLYTYNLNDISFANDTALRWYTNNMFNEGPLNKLWDYANNREKYFAVDSSGNGYEDYTMVGHKLLYTRKNKDSLFLNAMDSSGRKSPSTIINVNNQAQSRFISGYPCLYIKQKAAVSIYRFADSSYQFENTVQGNYDVVAATADDHGTYLLLKDAPGKRETYYLYNSATNHKQAIDQSFHPKTIFQLYAGEKLLAASHPWNGSIDFFSLATGQLVRKVMASDPINTNSSKAMPDSNVVQQSVSVEIRQSGNNAFQNFYDEDKSEIIQVHQNKINFLDAASGCIKRWVPVTANESRMEYEISPTKKYILSRNEIKEEKWQYPHNIHVTNINSGKLVLNIEASGEKPLAKFLTNNLLFVECSDDENKNNYHLCDLNTGAVKIFDFPHGLTTVMDATIYNNTTYFIYSNDTSIVIQRDDGTRLLQIKKIKKNDVAFFSSGTPYLFIRSAGRESLMYHITTSQAAFVKKIPAGKNILYATADEKTCLVYYTDQQQEQRRYVYDLAKDKASPSEVVSPQLSNITAEISSISYSPDGRYLATANPNGKVMLWDLGTGKETKVLKVDRGGYITKLCFTPNGERLAASSGDIWETATGKNILSVTNRNIYNVNTIDVSKDGKYIISGGAYILLWDATSGEILNSYIKLDSSAYKKVLGGGIKEDYPLMVYSSAFHPNSKIFATGNKRGTIEIRDIDTGFIRRKNLATNNQADQKITDIKYSRSGEFILVLQKRTLYKLNSATLAIIDSTSPPAAAEFLSIDMSYDESTFATIETSGGIQRVQLRKIDDLSIIKEFSTPGGVFNKISFSPNRQHLATASDDGFCTIWDIATGKPVMYLNNIGEYGNVMVTPDNYYMASKSALNEVAFNINGEYYSFDQFDIYLNRPDIVLERLHYASADLLRFYRQAYLKRLAKLKGNTDTAIIYKVPLLELVNRNALPSSTKIAKQQLSFNVKDSLATGGNIAVTINNNKVYNRHFDNTGNINISVEVELGNGKNIIEAKYTNSKNIESRKQKITIEYKPAQQVQPKVWYIGIGISKYKDSVMNLRYAAKDIKDIALAIKKKYPTAIIDTLLNASATKDRIAELKKKLLTTGINDRVIVSFSGHGLVDDSLNWYFATYDIDFKMPKQKGLEYNAMQDLLDGIPARQKLLLLDACHSGEQDKADDITFANKETAMEAGVKEAGARGVSLRIKNSSNVGLQNSFELMQELFANLQYGNGASVIAAAGGKEYAFENDTWKNGVFTYSLLKALHSKETDEDGDGIITVKELKKIIFESVKQLTGGRQKPTSRVEAYEDWRIW